MLQYVEKNGFEKEFPLNYDIGINQLLLVGLSWWVTQIPKKHSPEIADF